MVIVMVTLNYQLKQTTEKENGEKDTSTTGNDSKNDKTVKKNLRSSSIFFKEGQGSYSALSNVQNNLV